MAISDGPKGLEAIHTWNAIINLNDKSVDSQIIITSIPGLYSLPEADDNRKSNTGRRGETPLPGSARGKTIVYEGVLRAKTLPALRALATSFRSAFRDRFNEGFMIVGGSPDFEYNARVISCDIDEEQAQGPNSLWKWQRGFQLNLRMSDARYYALPKNALGPWPSASTHVVHNAGSTETDPDFSVTGIAANGSVTIHNATTNKSLIFHNLPTGNLVVAFKPRIALLGAVDVTSLIDVQNSSWWDEFVEGLVPGDNSITVTWDWLSGGGWAPGWYDAVE